VQQDLVVGGLVAVVLALAVPNAYFLFTDLPNMFQPPYKHPTIDKSHVKRYITWVLGLTILAGLYNLVVSLDAAVTLETTAYEAFFLAVGLIGIILYKREKKS
jgi:hypothetical protein